MRRQRRALAAGSLLLLGLQGSAAAQDEAEQPAAQEEAALGWSGAGAVAFDAVVLRPLGAIASGTGFLFFLISVPLVAPSSQIGTSWDIFVRGPFDYTFVRPLGDF
jgi:hypothetical protein